MIRARLADAVVAVARWVAHRLDPGVVDVRLTRITSVLLPGGPRRDVAGSPSQYAIRVVDHHASLTRFDHVPAQWFITEPRGQQGGPLAHLTIDAPTKTARSFGATATCQGRLGR